MTRRRSRRRVLAPAPRYGDLPSFVEWLTATYRRDIDNGQGRTWCPDWWKHAEAVEVLEGLWRAWEQLRLPEHAAFGRATFWRDWLYPLLRELTAEDGPFQRCSITSGHASVSAAAVCGWRTRRRWACSRRGIWADHSPRNLRQLSAVQG